MQQPLDFYLKNALELLFHNWNDAGVGLVAAALVDGDKVAYATTTRDLEGRHTHAERNVVEQFNKLHGKPSAQAVMVLTLTPCTQDLKGTTRTGESCADFLRMQGITRLYVGANDPMHEATFEHYKTLGFDINRTLDPGLKVVCSKLARMFPRYADQRKAGKSWLEIRNAIENTVQCPKKAFAERVSQEPGIRI